MLIVQYAEVFYGQFDIISKECVDSYSLSVTRGPTYRATDSVLIGYLSEEVDAVMPTCFRLLTLFSNAIISCGHIINRLLNKRTVNIGF